MKRSHAPVFWLLFGAGGMLSALAGTALVLVTGLATPLGWPLGADFMSYPRMLAFAHQWAGGAFIVAVVSLFAWHAVHRIYHSLHDVGVPLGWPAKIVCYGTAILLTLIAAGSLAAIWRGIS